MKFDPQTYRISGGEKYQKISLIVGLVGIILSVAGYFTNARDFYFAYLTSFIFWVSIGLGALFIVMLHHLVNAVWSVVVRRIVECAMMTLPVMAILFIPIIFGLSNLYKWDHILSKTDGSHASSVNIVAEAHASTEVADDSGHDQEAQLLQKKKAYLNSPFFIIRTIVYFIIWSILATLLFRTSLKQDKEGYAESQDTAMRKVSAPGMILFAFTISFAAFDWMMSLDPLWYSTIYGAYFFAGCVVAIMAFISIMAGWFRSKDILKDIISFEHYHTFGKLFFAFIIFWAYMAFSQYLLIWYANIPEETTWYHLRWIGGWKHITIFIALAHFTIPFIILMPQSIKRNPKTLGFFAAWMLLMHWVDLYWNIQPNLYPQGAGFSWMNLTTMMGVGSVFFYFFWKRLTAGAILTFNDPKLDKSLKYVN